MKGYTKPVITDELLELKDVLAASNDGETIDGESKSLFDLFGGNN